MVASVQSTASTERRDTYASSTTKRVPLPCFAPNSRRRARGLVQLDVYTALAVATALPISAGAVQTPIGLHGARGSDRTADLSGRRANAYWLNEAASRQS